MSLALMLALQAAAPAGAGAPAPAPAPFAALDFDLGRYRPAGTGPAGQGCRADDPAPIMVCARRPGGGAYPMAEWARIFAPRPLRAERDLGGGAVLGFHTEAAPVGPGLTSSRMMFGLRIAF